MADEGIKRGEGIKREFKMAAEGIKRVFKMGVEGIKCG